MTHIRHLDVIRIKRVDKIRCYYHIQLLFVKEFVFFLEFAFVLFVVANVFHLYRAISFNIIFSMVPSNKKSKLDSQNLDRVP